MRAIIAFLLTILCAAHPAFAQGFGKMTRAATPATPHAIPLYSGVAPGSENATQHEVWTQAGPQVWARNVVRPTLEPVLPAAGKANGTAVIVIPGGGFQFVSMNNEGWPVAKWLAARGVTAFVLKYRTMPTPDAEADFMTAMMKVFSSGPKTGTDVSAGVPFAVADAQAALKMVRNGATKWHIDPKRVGMIGFSAGAMTTLGVTLADNPDARADFIGVIYGPMKSVAVPADAPPMFNAMARDDMFFGHQGYGLIEAWDAAKRPVEFHLYDGGGHGFGSMPQHKTSDLWFTEFADWMDKRGLLKGTKLAAK
jgi:acetyl esterase/lipase